MFRITSYNVCYTKLLRIQSKRYQALAFKGMNHESIIRQLKQPIPMSIATHRGTERVNLSPIVITSYSIHYTKLYEKSLSDPALVSRFQSAQGELSGALSRLLLAHGLPAGRRAQQHPHQALEEAAPPLLRGGGAQHQR